MNVYAYQEKGSKFDMFGFEEKVFKLLENEMEKEICSYECLRISEQKMHYSPTQSINFKDGIIKIINRVNIRSRSKNK